LGEEANEALGQIYLTPDADERWEEKRKVRVTGMAAKAITKEPEKGA